MAIHSITSGPSRETSSRQPTSEPEANLTSDLSLGRLGQAVADPRTASRVDVLSLQRLSGNRAVSRLLAGSSPRQAAMQCKTDPRTEGAGEARAAPSGPGRELPEPTRAKMEAAFGADFSTVRVHHGAHVSALGAHAYTQGDDIHFAPGHYDPASSSGQWLLAHELTHVVQQRAGKVAIPQGKGAPINADPALEAEADTLGAKAASGERVMVAGAAAGTQRKASGSGVIQRGAVGSKGVKNDDPSNGPPPQEPRRAERSKVEEKLVSTPWINLFRIEGESAQGLDITDTTAHATIGERVRVKVALTSGSAKDVAWTIGGQPVAKYEASNALGAVTWYVPPTSTDTEFYWWKPGEFRVTAKIGSKQAHAVFAVKGPGANIKVTRRDEKAPAESARWQWKLDPNDKDPEAPRKRQGYPAFPYEDIWMKNQQGWSPIGANDEYEQLRRHMLENFPKRRPFESRALWSLHYGIPWFDVKGIEFHAQISESLGGQFCWVQISQGTRTTRSGQKKDEAELRGLDGGFPYGEEMFPSVLSPGNNNNNDSSSNNNNDDENPYANVMTDDSPSEPLRENMSRVDVNDDFWMWLMFRPRTSDWWIWVPISKVHWGWRATAERVLASEDARYGKDDTISPWKLTASNSFADVVAVESDGKPFPEWNKCLPVGLRPQ